MVIIFNKKKDEKNKKSVFTTRPIGHVKNLVSKIIGSEPMQKAITKEQQISSLPIKEQAKIKTKQTGQTFRKVGNIVRDVIQGTARTAGMVGVTATEPFIKNPVVPESRVSKILFGKGPVRTLEGTREKTQRDIESFGVNTRAAGAVAPALIVGQIFADFSGGGKPGKVAAKELIEKYAKNKITRESLEKELTGTLKEKRLIDDLMNIIDGQKEYGALDANFIDNYASTVDNLGDETPNIARHQELSRQDLQMPKEGEILSPEKSLDENFSYLDNTKQPIKSQGLGTKIRERFEDSLIRLKKIEKERGIKHGEGNVLSPWETKQLTATRTASKLREMENNFVSLVDDITDVSKSNNIDPSVLRKDINEYVIARHAPERNSVIGKPRAAGMTDDEAFKKIEELKNKPYFGLIENYADTLSDLNKNTLEILSEGGLISKEFKDSLFKKYPNHVPLLRKMDDELDNVIANIGSKFDIKTSGILQAKGSERDIEDIVENIYLMNARAIQLAERNKFGLSLMEFAKENKDIFKIVSDSPSVRPDDARYFGVRDGGKQKWIVTDDPKLGAALKGVNMDIFPETFKFVATYTRLLSKLSTGYNPDYLLSGHVRDLQEMLTSVSATKDLNSLKTISNNPESYKTIFQYNNGIKNKNTDLYKEFLSDGGGMGGMALSTKRYDVAADLSQVKNVTKKTAKKFLQNIDKLNEILENSNRFSVYKEARKNGLSRDRAAYLAQESTINFSRKGTSGPVVSALYMFANASVQGTTKMLRALKNPKTAAKVVSAIGLTTYLTSQNNDIVAPDWRDEIPPGTRARNIIIVTGKKENGDLKFFKIPVSWGLLPVKVAGDAAYDFATGHENNVVDGVKRIIAATIEGYNPLGGTTIGAAITPTIADPFLDIALNRTYSGSKIKPETYGKPIPESERYFQNLRESSTGRGAIKVTDFLADNGVEVSPADIMYGFQQLQGGTGRFIGRVVNTTTGLLKNEMPPSYEIPIINRFYESIDEERLGANKAKKSDVGKFLVEQERERVQQSRTVTDTVKEIEGLNENQRGPFLKNLYQRDPELVEKVLDKIEEDGLGLSSNDKKIKQLGVENGVRAEFIVSEINKLGSNQEKKAYLKDLYSKKILTDTVLDQVVELLGQ